MVELSFRVLGTLQELLALHVEDSQLVGDVTHIFDQLRSPGTLTHLTWPGTPA